MARKTTASKKASGKKTAVKKASSVAKKKTSKAKAVKKATKKKIAAKKVAKKAVAKKTAAKKVAKKTATKKSTAKKAVAKKATKKTTTKKSVAKKATAKKAVKKAPAKKVAKKVQDDSSTEVYKPPVKRKTRLSDAHLARFKEMLLLKRMELTGDMRNLSADALRRSRQDASGDLSSMPIHMADLGTDNWEQEFTLGLIANERKLVREIDDALARIEDRTYGVCEVTGKTITLTRLRAKPWARYCIEYARQRELGQA